MPELEGAGFAEFHRYYLVESQKQGLILDIRWNEGASAHGPTAEPQARQCWRCAAAALPDAAHLYSLVLSFCGCTGGYVSDLLAEKLSRIVMGYDINRYCAPAQFPSHAVNGPVVLLVDENTSSGASRAVAVQMGRVEGAHCWVGVWWSLVALDGAHGIQQPQRVYA